MQLALAQYPEQADDDRVLVTQNAAFLDGSSGSGDGSDQNITMASHLGVSVPIVVRK
jgi:hypothetical protein